MDYYAVELLDYLDLYKVLIEKGLYNPEKKNEVQDVNKLIDKLNEYYETKNLDSFDFVMLRKKIASVFHPDIYKISIPKDLDIDNNELLSKVNGAIDSIIECKKDGMKFNYDYDETHYSKEEIFNENVRTPGNSDFTEGVYIALKYLKERINAHIFRIPSNEKDYTHIREQFSKELDNLDYRKKKATEQLRRAREEKTVIANLWQNDLARDKIEGRYFREFAEKQKVMENAKSLYESAKKRLDTYVDVNYREDYEELMAEWKETHDEILQDVMNSKMHLADRQKGIKDDDPRTDKEIKKELKKFEREYKAYPKREAFSKKTINHLTKGDKEYKSLKYDCNLYGSNYAETNRIYEYYVKEKEKILKGYVREVNDEYSNKQFKANWKVKHYERKIRRINNAIMRNIKATDVFEQKFKYNYMPEQGEVIAAGKTR